MLRYKSSESLHIDTAFQDLLKLRRTPFLSEKQEIEILQKLEKKLLQQQFLLALDYREAVSEDIDIRTVSSAHFLIVNNERYLPVFSEEQMYDNQTLLSHSLDLFQADFLDLLIFLEHNPNCMGIIVNPEIDDLLLDRALLPSLFKKNA